MTQPPPMPTIPYQTPRLLSFRDRSGTLQAVGVLFIIGGALCGCFTAMTPIALVAPRPAGTPQQPLSQILTAVVVYAILCAALLTLGIGCVRKRRWTRPLILVFGWIGLILGVMGMVMWTTAAPRMGLAMRAAVPAGATPPPPALVTVMVIVVTVFMAVIYVIIPSLLLWLFRGEDVRATLEHYDPTPRWTDGVPLPVLGLCATLALGGLWALMALLQGWFFFMGVLLTGVAARVTAFVVAGLFAATAYLCYRRRPIGWMLALALFVILPLAWVTTLLRLDTEYVYRQMGMDEAQLRVLRSMGGMTGPAMAIWISVVALAAIIFTIRTRSHFITPSDTMAGRDDPHP